MFEANKITVVVDPEVDNANVIAKAMLLAKVSRAQVELVYSEYVHYLEDGYFYDPVVAKTLREEHSAVNADKVAAMAQTLREASPAPPPDPSPTDLSHPLRPSPPLRSVSPPHRRRGPAHPLHLYSPRGRTLCFLRLRSRSRGMTRCRSSFGRRIWGRPR